MNSMIPCTSCCKRLYRVLSLCLLQVNPHQSLDPIQMHSHTLSISCILFSHPQILGCQPSTGIHEHNTGYKNWQSTSEDLLHGRDSCVYILACHDHIVRNN